MSSTRSRILHRFGPSRIRVFRFRVYADLSRSPACFPLLRPLLTSDGISSSGSPQVRTRCFPAQPLHLPRRRNLWVSLCGASSPGRIGLLCSSCSSAHRFRLAFLPPVGYPPGVGFKHGSGAGESRHDPLATAQDRGFDHRQRAPGVCPVGQRVCLEGAL